MHFWAHSCPGESRKPDNDGPEKSKNASLHKGGQTLQRGLQKKELQSWHIQLGMAFAKRVSPAGVRPPAPTARPAGGAVAR